MSRNYRFTTDRLLVNEWHSLNSNEWPNQNLVEFVQQTMTEGVTHSLPPAWQGAYSTERAQQWIRERDEEGTTLLAVDKAQNEAIGLIILFESDKGRELRLGYMLNESSWGKGYASELIGGLVEWCRYNGVKSVTGGVERNNIASRRVLEKSGFQEDANAINASEQMFSIHFS